MSEQIYGEDVRPDASAYVPVTVQVHVDDLASFYAALAAWAEEAGGSRGRMRVS